MKTKIHYGNKVSTVKGNTVFCDTELELFNTFINGQFIFYKQHGR